IPTGCCGRWWATTALTVSSLSLCTVHHLISASASLANIASLQFPLHLIGHIYATTLARALGPAMGLPGHSAACLRAIRS
ncbi:hypothetical protein E4U50_000861, partial [Claviceps purpurea]